MFHRGSLLVGVLGGSIFATVGFLVFQQGAAKPVERPDPKWQLVGNLIRTNLSIEASSIGALRRVQAELESVDDFDEASRVLERIDDQTWRVAKLVNGAAPDYYLKYFAYGNVGPGKHVREALDAREMFFSLSQLENALRAAHVCRDSLGGLREDDMQKKLDEYTSSKGLQQQQLAQMTPDEVLALAKDIASQPASSPPTSDMLTEGNPTVAKRIEFLAGCWKKLPGPLSDLMPNNFLQVEPRGKRMKLMEGGDARHLTEDIWHTTEEEDGKPSGTASVAFDTTTWTPVGKKLLAIEDDSFCPPITAPAVQIFERAPC